MKKPVLEFLIEGLDMLQSSEDDMLMLPKAHLVSFKVSEWFTYRDLLRPVLPVVKALADTIISNDKLRTLHLSSSYTDTCIPLIQFEEYEKLPVLEALTVHGYRWFPLRWDWSRLTYLDLQRVDIVHFLRGTNVRSLRQLRVFMTDGNCSLSEEDQATDLICGFIQEIDALEKLSITVTLARRDCIPEIVKHGPTLHTLEVRDYAEPDGRGVNKRKEWQEWQVWSLKELNTIRRSCPRLMELSLNCTDTTMVSPCAT